MRWGRQAHVIRLVVLCTVAAGSTLAPVGCYRAVSVREDPGARPRAFAEAEEAYLRHDTARALHLYQRYRQQNPGSRHEALALYFEGQCLALEGRPILARQRLEQARKDADEALRGSIAMSIGNTYFTEDRYDEAEGSYLSARGSGGVPPDEVLFKSALCARRLGRWEEADRRLRQVVDRFPDSHRAESARFHLAWTDRHFAIQAGMFRVKKHAENRADEIRKAGLSPRLQTIGSPGKTGRTGEKVETLFRVSVGKFGDYAEAKREMSALRKKGVLTDALIIP